MPISYPPDIALREYLGSTTRHTRRVEIYEADGVTRWGPDIDMKRLVGGTITVDYNRNERRAMDLELASLNEDLQSYPGGFWYDKIIKVFRGVRINERLRIPKVLILNDETAGNSIAIPFRKMLVDMGYGDVRINQTASDYLLDGKPFDIIIGLNGAVTGLGSFFKAALDDGKSVMTFGTSSVMLFAAQYPAFGTSSVTPVTLTSLFGSAPHAINTGWASVAIPGGASILAPTGTGPGGAFAKVTATSVGTRPGQTAILSTSANPNGRASVWHIPMSPALLTATNFDLAVKASMAWLNTVAALATWEVQVGEFMIDRISEENFPHTVSITGRDYTKKCLLSKYRQATQFTAGQTLEALIASISGAAGITKRALPATGITVGRTFFYDRGVDRWSAMKEICSAYDYDIFFDAAGYLIIKPYADPATTAPTVIVQTGKFGTLAHYQKSTSDARIYNVIVVTGESSDATTIPVSAYAENTDPTSPTRIAAIGERVYQYTSSFIQTVPQAQAVADSFLAVHALEEYDLSFDSLMMPWLEVGDIMGFVDPSPAPGDPDTFLLSTISIPIELGPMGSVGKRVLNVS